MKERERGCSSGGSVGCFLCGVFTDLWLLPFYSQRKCFENEIAFFCGLFESQKWPKFVSRRDYRPVKGDCGLFLNGMQSKVDL